MKTINQYKRDATELRKEILRLQANQRKYFRLREWLDDHFSFLVDTSAENKTPNLPYTIKNVKDILVETKLQ